MDSRFRGNDEVGCGNDGVGAPHFEICGMVWHFVAFPLLLSSSDRGTGFALCNDRAGFKPAPTANGSPHPSPLPRRERGLTHCSTHVLASQGRAVARECSELVSWITKTPSLYLSPGGGEIGDSLESISRVAGERLEILRKYFRFVRF